MACPQELRIARLDFILYEVQNRPAAVLQMPSEENEADKERLVVKLKALCH